MKLLALAGAIGLAVVPAFRCALAGPDVGDEKARKLAEARQQAIAQSGIQPREDEKVANLVYDAVSSFRPENRTKYREAVLALDRDRVLAALADRLLNMEYGHHYVEFVAQSLPDERLIPFMAARIRVSQDYTLSHTLKRLHHAPEEFLRGLVPVLIEYALDSDYQGRGGPSGMTRSWSTLAEATQLLDKATEGKAGIKLASAGELLGREGSERKGQLRTAWRAWWVENRDNWPPKESEAPSRGDGVTVVKPPEDKKTDEEKAPPKGDSAGGATDPPPAKP
jgi:hypothetical protein